MSKTKKQEKLKQKQEASNSMVMDQPSKECWEFVVELILRFYKAESSMALEMKHVHYREESISKFKMEMQQRMMDALHNPRWMDETHKSGYMKFLQNMVHDSIWNAKNILNSHWKKHRAGQEGLKDVITRIDLYFECFRLFTTSRNRAQSISWWRSTIGKAEEASQRRHLIALSASARVTPVDHIERKGGYATIRRVRIDGVPEIQLWWEFAAKRSTRAGHDPI
jgi:hypothetical protein